MYTLAHKEDFVEAGKYQQYKALKIWTKRLLIVFAMSIFGDDICHYRRLTRVGQIFIIRNVLHYC